MKHTVTLKDLAIAFANNQEIDYYDSERCLGQSCRIVALTEDSVSITNGEYQYDNLSFDKISIRGEEGLYSGEEVKNILREIRSELDKDYPYDFDFVCWFEQFKKK